MKILKNLLTQFYSNDYEYESKPIPENDSMGREKFWEDLGRPND